MSVYLKDGLVLLSAGRVATNAACCCGGSIPCPDNAATSGSFVIGETYKIDTYHSGDDFTNIGASSNASGVVFVATGTTAADWSNGSVVIMGYVVYVTLSGVTLCSCIDPGGGSSYSMVDGHYPGGTGTGINAEWNATSIFLNHWQYFTENFTPTDPYCYPLEYDGSSCSGAPAGANLSSCILNVICSGATWTVTIEHSGFGFFFTGTGLGTVANPILNDFLVCDGTGTRQVGIGGQAIISFVP